MIYRFKSFLSGSHDVVSGSIETSTVSNSYKGSDYSIILEKIIRHKTIYPRFRFYVLNPDETKNYELPQEDILTGGNYQENYQSGQRRTISLTLNNEDGIYSPTVGKFFIGTRFSFEIGLQIPDDEDESTIWFNKGIYYLSSASPSEDVDQKTISFELKDKFGFLESTGARLSNSYTIEVGTEIKEVIQSILTQDIGNGYLIDPKSFIYDISFEGKVTSAKISGEAGGTWADIINDLAKQLSAEVFYNTEGILTFAPITEVVQDYDKPNVFNFFYDEGDFASSSYDFDLEAVTNRVIVLGTNVNSGTVRSEAVNDSADSPFNVERIGYRTADIINDSMITTQVLADERARYELRKISIQQTTVSNTVYFNPILSVNNIITLTDDFFKFKKERFVLQSISYSIDYEGTMSITSTNIKNLNFK